ncbi:ground-like domain protein, partial [Teladorsagia circumcincta]
DIAVPIPMARLRKKGGRGDGSCTDESLRKIMNESMGEHMAETKRAVHRAISRAFDGSFGVICAECAFSYIVHTHEYCVHTRNDITCLVYKDG